MISDAAARLRATTETEKSFFVEAAAGTGKTKTLLDRILKLVLESGPEGPPIRMDQVAAITFTEKAAGEMRIRLRQELESRLRESELIGERAREALRDLERASISTIHSFAVSLLKERPIEARLDPRFAALDPVQSDRFFRDTWQMWIGKALLERSGPLERALRAGFGLERMQTLADNLRLRAHIVRSLILEPAPTDEELRGCAAELLRRGESFRSEILDAKDKLAPYLEDAIAYAQGWPEAEFNLGKPGGAGKASSWARGKTSVQEVKQFINLVHEFHATSAGIHTQRLCLEIVEWLRADFLAEWEARKRANGLLDFDDQLALARDLLKRSPAARSDFQHQYRTLLIDEFQDTDPVQLDIALLLSSSDLNLTDTSKMVPEPGRLFVVGDPKQSIYRFRGADIETYLGLGGRVFGKESGLEKLELNTNYRSVPSILRFVDKLFSEVMVPPEDGDYQPAYLQFDEGARQTELANSSVYILGDKPGHAEVRSASETAEIEAARIARLIRTIVGGGSDSWKVSERNPSSSSMLDSWQPPKYGDIGILLPVLTHSDVLEAALRDSAIPYVVEGGRFYYSRSEVSSAISVLRAISNPNDAVSLYAALRSIFFGLSDDDLLRLHIDGNPLDYREEVSASCAAHRAFELLRRLHQQRHRRPASETLEVLLRETGAREVLTAHRGGFQSVANLGKLVRTLRVRQESLTFSQVVEFLSEMDEGEIHETESRVMEERGDAVRIMSIHKAKGLDFPIVFLAGLGITLNTRASTILADPHQEKIFAVAVGKKELSFQTPGWERLKGREKLREKAELIRLLYVGLTRARDHLVVCTHLPWIKKKEGFAPKVGNTRLFPIFEQISRLLESEEEIVRKIDGEVLDSTPVSNPEIEALPTEELAGVLRREYEDLNQFRSRTPAAREIRTPSGGERVDSAGDEAREDRTSDLARERALRLGIAFHEAMEEVDFARPEEIARCAAGAGRRHQLPPSLIQDLEEMVRRCLSSDFIARVRRAQGQGRKAWREVPFIRPLEETNPATTIEEGKIDLLFEEDGGWVIVDYKTDRAPEQADPTPFFRTRYSGQILAYAQALRSMRVPVKNAYLLLARTGEHIEMPLVSESRA